MQGHKGWDEYAPFYDWENARTFGRRDVPFWTRLVTARGGRVLELGCGTGRVTLPLARTGAALVSRIQDGPDGLRAAIDTVLTTPTFRHRAQEIRATTRNAPSPHEALTHSPTT